MKTKLRLFCLLLCLSIFSNTFAIRFEIDGIWYSINADNISATVTYCNTSLSGNISIPSTVTYENKVYSVTSIGDYAFKSCRGLTKMTIPNSMTSIGYEAFRDCDGLTSVIFDNCSTSIGDYAFKSCDNLTELDLGNGVTNIGNYAFEYCRSLTQITIPNSVTSIGDYAFRSCDNLTELDLGNGVTTIGDYAFVSCSGLTKMTIPNSMTSIGDSAFECCNNLTELDLGNGVTSIGNYAFYGCSGLTKMTIPNSMTSIGYKAFSGCDGLTSVIFDNCSTSIGDSTFEGCNNLTELDLGNGVTSIGNYAFKSCSGLTKITIPNSVTSIGDNAFNGCSGLTELNLGNGLTSIGDYAFGSCIKLTSVTFGNIPSIGSQVFGSCSNIRTVVFGDNIKELNLKSIFPDSKYISSITLGKNISTIYNFGFNTTQIQNIICKNPTPPTMSYNIFGKDNKISLEVPITTTPNYAKSEYWGGAFRIYAIKDGKRYYTPLIKEEGEHFLICDKTELEEGEIVTVKAIQPIDDNKIVFFAAEDISDKIGSDGYQFAISSILRDNTIYAYSYSKDNSFCVTLDNGGELIDKITIEEIPNVYKLKIKGNVNGTDILTIRKMTNLQILDLQEASIIDGGDSYYQDYVTSKNKIGSYFFMQGNKIKNIKLPNNLEMINSYAFNGCYNLETISIPASTVEVLGNAFSGSNLTTLRLEYATTPLTMDMYNLNTNIQTLYYDRQIKYENDEYLGDNYYGRFPSSLISVYIGKNITTIYDEFNDCTNLQEVHISDLYAWCKCKYEFGFNPTRHGHNLYLNNKLITDLVIPEGITIINNDAFYGCDKIISVTFPDNVTSIGKSAFQDCIGLTEIIIPSNVTNIANRTFFNCRSLAKVTIPSSVTGIGEAAFSRCNSLTKIFIPNSVTSIGESAFQDCIGLTEISIPDNVTSIKNRTFYCCSNIKKLTIPNSVTGIGSEAFYNCSNITEVNIPNSVTSIGVSAFSGCSGLTEITIPNSVTSIGGGAFGYCSGIKEVTIPSSVSVLGNSAFAGCNGLKINVCNGITTIGDDFTFNGCSGVTEIITPNSVINIKYSAFDGCSDLKSITIGSKVENIESGAFDECKNIEEVNSLNTTPPAITERTFAYETYDKATLYVPTGCRNIYWLHPYWEDFFEIKEKDFQTGITNPTIEDNEQTFEIANGKIHFIKDGENVYIYNIDGTIVYKGVSQCGKTVEVPAKGIYIVKSGSYSTKVAL